METPPPAPREGRADDGVRQLPLEQEARAELHLARIADAGNRTRSAAGTWRSGRCRCSCPPKFTVLNRLKNSAKTPIRRSPPRPKNFVVRRSSTKVVVAARRVDRDLLAGRRIDVAIVVGAVAVQVGAGRQVVRAGARRLEDRRELDAVRHLEHAHRDEAMTLVAARRSPLAVARAVRTDPAPAPPPRRLPCHAAVRVSAGERVVRLEGRARQAALELERQRVIARLVARRPGCSRC